ADAPYPVQRGGVSGRVGLAEQGGAARGGARNLARGRPGAPLGGHYDPPARSWLIRAPMPWKARPGIEKSRSGAPRGEGPDRKGPGTPRQRSRRAGGTGPPRGAAQAPRASRRSPPPDPEIEGAQTAPLRRGEDDPRQGREDTEEQTPGRLRATGR